MALWKSELRKNGIILSDVGGISENIDVLIGANVAGKLLTGKKRDSKNGLILFETRLGWTVMGKILTDGRKEYIMFGCIDVY